MSKEPSRNVYVGHRYVPKIMGQWDKEQKYEGLSIVEYEGSSFTSKKYVPVGIDITNEEFWVNTGNYNIQVENYRQEVVNLDSKVTQNTDSISELNDDVLSFIDDSAVSPERFEGSDFEKVQQAVNYATENGKHVRFSRMYDITGHTVEIRKTNDRRILSFLGAGGGIIKNDAGYVFTAPSDIRYIGDVQSHNMKFESVAGGGTIVWNAGAITNGIIRLGLNNDTYKSVDHVISTTDYIQSVRIIGCTITGGRGWAIEYSHCFDVSIENNTIEHRYDGIRNIHLEGKPSNNTLRIVNNVIEGLSGKGVELGSSFGVTISGNYMEANVGGYFDLSGGVAVHTGLVITGNTVQQSRDQRDSDDYPAFKINNIGSQGIQSSNNVATGLVYQIVPTTYSLRTSGKIVSVGDSSVVYGKVVSGDTERFIPYGRLGVTRKERKSVTSPVINAGKTTTVEIDFSEFGVFDRHSIVTIRSESSSGSINFSIEHSVMNDSGLLRITIRNNEEVNNFRVVVTAIVMDINK